MTTAVSPRQRIILAAPLPPAVKKAYRYHHVSQWITLPGGGRTGGNGCAEAALSRAVMEYDPATPPRLANPEWRLARAIHDPKDPTGIDALQNRISWLARNQAIGPDDRFTSDIGIEAVLTAFGLDWTAHYVSSEGFSAAWDAAFNAVQSIIWVDGAHLSGAYQSNQYFAGEGGHGNHIMTYLGNLDGAHPARVNDPLADVPDEATDTDYSPAMLKAAFYGCWTIPDPVYLGVPHYTTRDACDLKTWPNDHGGGLNPTKAKLPAGQAVTPTGYKTQHWTQVTVQQGAAHLVGMVHTDNILTAQ